MTAADWVQYHHATLFVELKIVGDIKNVKLTARPFDAWLNYPMVTGIWQTNSSGDWKVIKRMVGGVIGDPHGAGKPCRVPSGPHGSGWTTFWGPFNSNKGWFPVSGLGEGRYVIGVYARNSGTITIKVEGTGADAKYNDTVTLTHSGQHPHPGD